MIKDIIDIAKEAGKIMTSAVRPRIMEKSGHANFCTETDEKIRKSLEMRFGTATIILISHRISTLSKADKIIVLDRGRIAETGTHDELKAAGGIYEKIYHIQTGTEQQTRI